MVFLPPDTFNIYNVTCHPFLPFFFVNSVRFGWHLFLFFSCSRLYQMAKLYLFGASSGLYSCPLAMTDGAAQTIEVLKLKVSLNHIEANEELL